ncbi:MAG: hypothetical protein NTW04_02880, partial [Elusimicrobia bacterium]|nr:hypothetical protein [Elusimicrobiota bacterium]
EFSELKEELDKITSGIKKAARHALDAGRIISIFSDVIFKFGGLRVSEQYSQNPQSYCLYDVLRRRIGSPALISSLYIIIGKRLDIPLCGVNMPGNFAVMLKTWNGGILIDVSHCGRIISPTECRAILISKKILWDEQFLKPLNNRQLLAQILCGLIGIYRRLEETIPQQHLKKMLAVL